MKKMLFIIGGIALLAMAGCKKDSAPTTTKNQAIVNEIFKAGMLGLPSTTPGTSKSATLKSTYPINVSVDKSVSGPAGGTIHVTGSVTGSFNFTDGTSPAFTGGTMFLEFNETINDYAFIYEGQTYTMNGAPYISLAGTFTFTKDGTFGTASSMTMGGGVRVTGPSFDQTININITIIINSSGKGGRVSGTVGGESVNYSF
jgi:hypothetical protein